MNAFESPDPRFLASAGERSLELWRHELVVNCDDRREAVIDELLRRGTATITSETVRLGRTNGLSRQQIIAAGEEAAVTLAMRVRTAARLKLITPLARDLAGDAIRARAVEPDRPPRLVSRPPELREISEKPDEESDKKPIPPKSSSIDEQLREALRHGTIRRNNPETS